MQTLHEGTSDIFFFSHPCTVATDKMNDVLIFSKMCLFVCKSVLPLFRCLTSIERSVERCQISVSSMLTDRVMIQFFCRHGNVCRCCITNHQHLVAVFPNYHLFFATGITKTYNLRFQESEALQAVFATHLCPNMLKCPARLVARLSFYKHLFARLATSI